MIGSGAGARRRRGAEDATGLTGVDELRMVQRGEAAGRGANTEQVAH
jgi:hypothetical protein